MRRKAQSHRMLHWLGGRGVATLALGAALSVGGVTEALPGRPLPRPKDLDTVRVVKQRGHAREGRGQARRRLRRQLALQARRTRCRTAWSRSASRLFDDDWISRNAGCPKQRRAGRTTSSIEEMQRINVAIRREFFANAVPFGDIIHDKAQKYDVDPALVAAVVETESRFQPRRALAGRRARSDAAHAAHRPLDGRANLYDPEQNVDAGAKYLKYLNARFDGNLKKTIAAYNAGEGNVRRYNGVPPFRETRSYVKKVMSRYEKQQAADLKKFDRPARRRARSDDAVLTLR